MQSPGRINRREEDEDDYINQRGALGELFLKERAMQLADKVRQGIALLADFGQVWVNLPLDTEQQIQDTIELLQITP